MSDGTDVWCVANKEIQSLLKDVAKQEGFRTYRIEKTDGSPKGGGYLGIITFSKIIGKDERNRSKVLNVVVKSASNSDALRSEMPVSSAYSREIYMYNTVLPLFRTFELKKRLPPSCFSPKMYKVNLIDKSEALVLENLKEHGYVLHERGTPMNSEHVSLVMTEYGRLHALSFAIRDQNPEQFQKILIPMDDILLMFMKENFFDTVMHRCIKALESLDPKTDKEAVKKFGALINKVESFVDELRIAVDDYAVALHGDCWINNIMFKYEDKSNPAKPTKLRFIDFQEASLGSPVMDLSYFFYTCSSKEIIDKLDFFLQIYYESLSTYLLKLGSNPIKMFPYSVLQKQWKEYAKLGLIVATVSLHTMLTEENEAVDFKDIAQSGKSCSDVFNYQYNDRIRHIILHFVENNFI